MAAVIDGRRPDLLAVVRRAVARVVPEAARAVEGATAVELRRVGASVHVRVVLADPRGYVAELWAPRVPLLEAWRLERSAQRGS